MKKCPQCSSIAFDDAEVCYECMYRFGEGDMALSDDLEEPDVIALAKDAASCKREPERDAGETAATDLPKAVLRIDACKGNDAQVPGRVSCDGASARICPLSEAFAQGLCIEGTINIVAKPKPPDAA